MSVSSLLLSVPPVVCGLLSFIACAYVCISAICHGYVPCNSCKKVKQSMTKTLSWPQLQQKLRRQSQNKSINSSFIHEQIQQQFEFDNPHPTMMIDILFWMCVSDGLHSIEIIINWFPLALSLPFWSNEDCKILGIFGQFFAIQSPCFHLLLAYNLGYLLCNGSISALAKQKKYQFMFVNVVPLLCTILPLIFDEYGMYSNNAKYDDYECWIISTQWQYIYVIAIALSLLLHYLVILYSFCKWKEFQQSGFDQHFKFIVIKLLRFVIIYTMIRFFPLLNRIWEFSTTETPPFALIFAHHVGISLLGLSDAVVWIINQKQVPYNRSYTKLSYADQKRKKLMPKRTMLQQDAMEYTANETMDSMTTDYWISTKRQAAPKGKFYKSKKKALIDRKETFTYPEFTAPTFPDDKESTIVFSMDV